MKLTTVRLYVALARTALPVQPTRAQTADTSFYSSRQIQMIIPSSTGGGYDLYGRLVAQFIGKYIPGSPTVVATNMPGAAGIVAARYVYETAPQDGSVVALFYSTALLDPLMNPKSGQHYDATRFQYLGSANAESFICFVRATAQAHSFQDAVEGKVVLGASGLGGFSTDYPAMYNTLLGTRFKVVNGYPGINEIGMAIEKGEIDGTCGASWSVMTTGHPNWLTEGAMRVLAQENAEANPEIARLGVPLTTSFAPGAQVRQIMEFVYSQSRYGRPFGVGPSVPAARVALLRAAFWKTMNDPDFLAAARKLHLDITGPMSGAQVQDAIAATVHTPDAIVAAARASFIARKP